MSEIKAVITFAILSCLALPLTSCTKAVDNTAVNSNNTVQQPKSSPANENADELKMVLQLPFESVECAWLETPATAQSGQKLTAVVRFLSADSAKFIAELSKSGESVAASIEPESWFPTELVTKSEMTGDEGLSGRAFSAALLYQPPYNGGRVVHIDETDFFVIELTTK